MDIRYYLKNNFIVLDGGMGTLLQAKGLKPGEKPEGWNITHPEVIQGIHRAYFDAGSNVVNTNTFGANILKFPEDELELIIKKAIENAKAARERSVSGKEKFISLDIGPTGRLLKPYGDLDFEDAVNIFKQTVRLGVKYGVDLITIETMSDGYETKAAVIAAKEESELPIFVTNAYSECGKLLTGATPSALTAILEGLGVDAIGVNCSFGPRQLTPIVDEILSVSSLPVIMKPNAGLPVCGKDGRVSYDVTPEQFSAEVSRAVDKGVRVVGGCCGTTDEHIELLSKALNGRSVSGISEKDRSVATSATRVLELSGKALTVGRSLDATSNEEFRNALADGDMYFIQDAALDDQDNGADIIYISVGSDGQLSEAVNEAQTVTSVPLMIESRDITALEKAVRRYNGKPIVCHRYGSGGLEDVLNISRKYGCVVAVMADECDITPESISSAIRYASECGVSAKDIVFFESEAKEKFETVKFLQ